LGILGLDLWQNLSRLL